jgi:cell division inhibitor SepF
MDEMVIDKPSLIGKFANLFTRSEEVDDFEPEIMETPSPMVASPMRQNHRYTVTIRREMQNFEDAMAAANGLKHGEQQILNLSTLAPDVKEKVLNFLCGVNYVQEGTWEELGTDVYLVAPKNALVEVAPATPRMTALKN